MTRAVTDRRLQTGHGHALAAERFVDFASALRLEDLPEEVVRKAKLLLLDTIGISIGSTKQDFAAHSLAAAAELGGTGDCTIIGQPKPYGAHAAAFANGVLAHGQDYDDTHIETLLHPSCVLVPALLAAAERAGLAGRDALVALVAGMEVALRLAQAADQQLNRRGFQTTAVAGTFGCALMAAMAAGLDRAGAINALGLAGSVIASGIMECVPAGASAKQTHPGWAAHCGLMAADLVRAGFTGPASIFEGPLGILGSYLHGLDVDLGTYVADLGRHWEILNVRSKLYPCGHPIHAHIECALAFRASHGERIDQIESVTCDVPSGAVHTVCEPLERKAAPTSGYETRFSLPFAVALTLMIGRAGPEEFSDRHVRDESVLAMARKVRHNVDPGLQLRYMPGRMTIRLKDGTVWQHELLEVRGGRNSPITADEIIAKFRMSCSELPEAKTEELADMILAFEDLGDVRRLTSALR